jgi:hypothetical protein
MNSVNADNNYQKDTEAAEDELKSVAYTAVSFICLVVTILIGSIILLLN